MVNVLANTSQFGPPLDDARKKLDHTFQSPASLHGLAHDLHGLQQSLMKFNSVIELGFGMRIGRHLFEKIHEGVIETIHGFEEASVAGDSFFESLGQGIEHAMGIRTLHEMIESVNKTMEENKHRITEVDESMTALIAKLKLGKEVAAGGLLFTVDDRFPGLKDSSKSQFEIERKKIELEKQAIIKETSNEELKKKGLLPGMWDWVGQGVGLGTVGNMNKEKSQIEKDQTRRLGELRQREQALDELAEKQKHQEEKDEQDKRNEKLLEYGGKLLHEAQTKLAQAMEKRAEQLKHDQAAADRIRAADDVFERFRQEATEAERLHSQKLLSDDEFNTRINKLREDVTRHEAEENKKKGLFASATAGRAVEAKSLEAYHDLAEFRAGGTHNPQLDETKKTNTILLDIKANVAKQNAADNLKNLGLDLLAGIASIL